MIGYCGVYGFPVTFQSAKGNLVYIEPCNNQPSYGANPLNYFFTYMIEHC
jgi:hypothetical protein